MLKIPRLVPFFSAVALLFASIFPFAEAQSLNEIDRRMRQDKLRANRSPTVLFGEKHFDPESNFYRVFETASGPANLLNWLGLITSDFVVREQSVMRHKEYAEARKVFRAPHGQQIELLILVPHPRYVLSRTLALLPAFASIEPPGLQINFEEVIEIQGLPAKIYSLNQGGCALQVPISQQGLLNLKIDHCHDKGIMLRLAEKFDIQSLNAKLES
jgi:hypothetical protein